MDLLAEFDYRDTQDIASVRHALPPIALAAGVPADRVDDLVLMAAELMVNALVHARTPQPHLWLARNGPQICLAVTDTCVLDPQIQPRDGNRVGGNGLRVVDALSDGWGVRHHDGLGKTVWFSLDQR